MGKKVVLIAGSMGSLEPIETIIRALPASGGLSYVVLQHQDPAFATRLPELISNWTSLPCAAIGDSTELLPDHIVVSRPGELLQQRGEQFFLVEDSSNTDRLHTIDRLASSLAENPELEVVLVVLSGSGHDGAEGAAAVRRSGGLVMVQDPGEAEASSMPLAVIDAQLELEVLPAAEMVFSLVRFAASVAPKGTRPELHRLPEPGSDDLLRIIALLKSSLGKDFSGYKRGTLGRRLARRVSLRELASVDEYIRLYGNDLSELQHLAEDLLIGVTSFYRDAAAYEVLQRKVLPVLLPGVDKTMGFRAWVVGCSTGEEAYSLAIVLEEYQRLHKQRFSVKIFATDADDAALEYARHGAYREEQIKSLQPEYLDRYFDQVGTSFVVRKSIREMVVFASQNVITDTPFSKLDLISCRNLLIYLNENIKSALLRLFHFSLNSQGVLFLGSTESVGRAERHFKPLSQKWRIYQRNDAAPGRRPDLPLSHRNNALRLISGSPGNELPSVFRSEGLLRRVLENHVSTQFLIDATDGLIFTVGDASPYLHVPAGEPTGNVLELLQPSLHASFRALLNRARQEGVAADTSTVLQEGPCAGQTVAVTATRIPEKGFEDCIGVSVSLTGKPASRPFDDNRDDAQWTIDLLRQEVDVTREDLQRTLRRSRASDHVLRQANEEIVAMNEELQSANEELEASKEEMQSLNDELSSTNVQLEARFTEIERLNQDLQNLLESSDSATLILDAQRRIKRFTPNIESLMRLRAGDIDRDVGDISRLFADPGFLEDIDRSLSAGKVGDVEISAADGRKMIRRLLPYRESGGVVSGAIINFIDISELYHARQQDQAASEKLAFQAQLLSAAAPIVARTLEGEIQYWNLAAAELWGYSAEEALGQNVHQLLGSSFPISLQNAHDLLLASGEWRGVLAQTTKAGRVIELSSRWALNRADTSRGPMVTEVYQDLSLTMQLRSALREEQELFHLLLDWTSDAEYWTDSEGRITYITPAIEKITGYSAERFLNDPEMLESLVKEDHRDEWRRHVSKAESPAPDHWKNLILPIVCRDRRELWVEHRYRIMYSSDSQILGYRGTIRDVNEMHSLESEARRLAFNDALTGLPNRRLFAKKLEEACAMSDRSRQYSALVMLDLDHFKRVNDTEGHSVGDELLIHVGEMLRRRLRAFDTVARLGGDEFLLILNSLGGAEMNAAISAIRICNEIRSDIAAEHQLAGAVNLHYVTGSLGIALFRGYEKSTETLMKQADMALYSAKGLGRDKVKLFDPQMQADVDRRMASEVELAAAQNTGDLMMYYQVQTNADGELIGAEALLRWRRSNGDIVSPDSFIDVLEDQPLVCQVGRWVLEKCLQQAREWESDSEQGSMDLSINVSAGYLLSEFFAKDVGDLLQATGVNPNRIVLELTENALLSDMDHVSAVLHKLKQRGLRFSLDDFGTGYSSLSHLRDLPLSQLKIDKSFIAGLPDSEKCESIIRSVIAVGKALNLDVVAEGVETDYQRDFLRELGCDIYQGYLFGHPVPADSFPGT